MNKETLLAAFAGAVEALVVQFPIQEQNRAGNLAWASGAKLGVVTRRVRSKGGYTDIPSGTAVLFAPDPYAAAEGREGGLVVWAPRPDGMPTRTVVGPGTVVEVCETCSGSGFVYARPDALCAVLCPGCASTRG